MNKTRFYEITQAAANGEDLSQFVPTNAAEAALIADLQGGGGSAVLSMGKAGTKVSADVFPLSKLYFNTSLTNEQMIEWMYAYADSMPNCFDDTNGVPFAFDTQNFLLAIMAMPTGGGGLAIVIASKTAPEYKVLYNSGNIGVESGFTGWNPELFTDRNYIDFDGTPVTADNYETNEKTVELLSEIMSFGKDFENSEEQLQGTYDGTPMTVNENYVTIDIVALLKEKKLPKIIKVEV